MSLKKLLLVSTLVLSTSGFGSGSLRAQEPAPVPESIAVRVWSEGRFVSDLNLADFELTEDGVPQTISSMYLISKNAVQRRDGSPDFQPNVLRKFYFLFQMLDYSPKLAEAVQHFFKDVYQPGDLIEIQTPAKVYRLSSQALAKMSKEDMAKELIEIIRNDITTGNLVYKGLLGELKRVVREISGTQSMAAIGEEGGGEETSSFALELLLPMYREALRKMESLRSMDEKRILQFARALKQESGQVFVFLIYQREFRPELSMGLYQSLQSSYQDRPDILANLDELFQLHSRNISLNPDKVKQAYADSRANFNFLFVNKKPETSSGIVMREQSEDIFKVFSEIAEESGGATENSQDPSASLVKALNQANQYYLLYYYPSSLAKDGNFKPIGINIKGKDFKIVSRRGRTF